MMMARPESAIVSPLNRGALLIAGSIDALVTLGQTLIALVTNTVVLLGQWVTLLKDCGWALIQIIRPPWPKPAFQHSLAATEWIRQTALIGFDSGLIVILISSISGVVLSLHAAVQFSQNGADSYIGALAAMAIVREMGPIFAALTVGARCGTAMASEIANMAVTQQVDALNTFSVNPTRYLVLPRLIAAAISVPLLTFAADISGTVSGMLVARMVAHLHFSQFLDSVWRFLTLYDLQVSLAKGLIFGILIVCIACTQGLNARGGAQAVGDAATRTAIQIAVAVLVTDFFLTWVWFSGRGLNQ